MIPVNQTIDDENSLKAGPDDVLARLVVIGIDATAYHHPPLLTVEQSMGLRGNLPGGYCKNLSLRDRKSRLWLMVCREGCLINLKALEPVIVADRLSFGSAGRLMRVLGMVSGAVSPFALTNDAKNQVSVILDEAMMDLSLLNYDPVFNEMTTAVSPEGLIPFIRSCGYEPRVLNLNVGD